MHFITINKLQREFGLSYVAAANLIEERRRVAAERYRPLIVLNLCGMVGFIVLTLAGLQGSHDAVRLIPLALLPLLLAHLYLCHRASRTAILAAARQWKAPGNVGAPCRSE